MTLQDIQSLDAGRGEAIPTLRDALGRATGRVGMMIEIITPGIAKQVSELVAEEFEGPLIFASFLHNEMKAVRELSPSAQTLALIEAVPVRPTEFARDAEVTHVGLGIDSVTADFVDRLKNSGLSVFVYTVNDPRDISWLNALGVDGLVSDFPERLAKQRA